MIPKVCMKLAEKFEKHRLVKPKLAVRRLATPLWMFDGMDQDAVPRKQPEVLLQGPALIECDRAKLERKKRKDERAKRGGQRADFAFANITF
ncbi:hypothetical protein MKW98_001687 [Papaver atlanticum]|uniref:Uncharacterized protein n=1 Tax=Papaver atlanticum TaxID=357466 RepID=A0AAD4S668_9MAGN|nr:hypothetical protein MKW98_001687 [Papaver atlanticum]